MKNNETKHRVCRRFSTDFKLSVLMEYFSGSCSKSSIVRKYDLSIALFNSWLINFENKALPLPRELSEIELKVYMSYKKRKKVNETILKSPEDLLREENERLRKALEYSELRNEDLHEVLKIGKDTYGIDLLKKAGAKQ